MSSALLKIICWSEVIRASIILADQFWGQSLFTSQIKHWGKSVPWVLLDSQALAGPSGWEWYRDPEVWPLWESPSLGTSWNLWLPLCLPAHVWMSHTMGTHSPPEWVLSLSFASSLVPQLMNSLISFYIFLGFPNDCVLWWTRCQQHVQIWGYLSKSQAGKHHESILVTIPCGFSLGTPSLPPLKHRRSALVSSTCWVQQSRYRMN